MSKQAIALKITGELFLDPVTKQFTRRYADSLAIQIKQLSNTHTFGIVIGGGAFFRGNEHNKKLSLRPATAHTIGMIATTMSSLILYDIFNEQNIKSTLLCAFECSLIGKTISQQALDEAQSTDHVIIFGGGTGNPFVSTDTGAVIRAKQLGATQLWKATNVDGVYAADPRLDKTAKRFEQLSYQEVLDKKLQFMDLTAITLAQQEQLTMRIFSAFTQNTLINAAQNGQWGTVLKA